MAIYLNSWDGRWIRTSWSAIKNSLSARRELAGGETLWRGGRAPELSAACGCSVQFNRAVYEGVPVNT